MANLILQKWISLSHRRKDLLCRELILLSWSKITRWSRTRWCKSWHSWHWWCSVYVMRSWWLILVVVVLLLSSLLVLFPTILAICLQLFVVHELKQMLDDLCQVRLAWEIIPFETTFEHSFVLFEISFVESLFSLNISNFFDLIVIDDHEFVIEGLLVQVLFSIDCTIWFLEANECKTKTLLGLLEAYSFNLSELAEEIMKLLISPMVRKVAHIKVVPLLWILIPQKLSLLLKFTIGFLHRWSQDEFGILLDFFVVESFNGFTCTLWTVFFAFLLGVIEADETELANLTLHEFDWDDVSKWSEQSFDFFFAHSRWNILDVNIVHKLPRITSVFWLEDQSSEFFFLWSFHSRFSSFFSIKAYEPIASRCMVFI